MTGSDPAAAPRLLESALPIVAAPMAGGPSTVELAVAIAGAGGFPFLAGGYQTAAGIAEQIERLRSEVAAFGVNLFVPSGGGLDPARRAAFDAYAAELRPEAERYGLELDPEPVSDDDAWGEKLALLRADPVPVVSLTFGLPDPADIATLQRAGTRVLATVTTVEEAVAATRAGVDGLVVQGPGAGGHSATHDAARDIAGAGGAGSGSAASGGTGSGSAASGSTAFGRAAFGRAAAGNTASCGPETGGSQAGAVGIGPAEADSAETGSAGSDPSGIGPAATARLVRRVRESVALPVVAAGGVDGPAAVRELLSAGAESVAVGTALLRADEAGTHPAHRAALADPAFTETVITRAFTGRPARALRNRFADQHGASAPVAYPEVHHLTRALRQAAGRAGDTGTMHLWAGSGFAAARAMPAADIVRYLAGR